MSKTKNYSKVDVLVVGAGPAGLAAAITLKKKKPDLDICVLDKAHEPGGHNLSGAVMEEQALIDLLEIANVDWRNSEPAREIFGRRIEKDNVLLFLGSKRAVTMMPAIKMAGLIRLGFGQMVHEGDYIVSISKLTKWLT
ncbi:MAG: NAD(P)-binding protein, partial [Sedimentisphaerales bacterium]|nr:NAD(P)-binding protein [Sedimentisphaerales bacterium]